MATALIKLVNDGLDADGKPFSAIYGSYTVDDKKTYTFGSYIIVSSNIASIYYGEIDEEPRIKQLLRT